MVDDEVIAAHAAEMLGVFRDHRLERHTDHAIADLTIGQAYRVQEAVVAQRVADGERHVGWKVGCTSRGVQAQFGLTEQINGHLMAPHVHDSGAVLHLGDYVDCAIEPEFVLHMATELEGHDLPDATLRSAIGAVSAGIEVHNYRFFHGCATSQELIASNGIHAAAVVGGERAALGDVDLALEGVGVWRNGELVDSGIGAEIMGGPLESLRWLVGHLTDRGRRLEAGALVIPGSPVGLIRVGPDDHIETRFARFGRCEATFVDGRRGGSA